MCGLSRLINQPMTNGVLHQLDNTESDPGTPVNSLKGQNIKDEKIDQNAEFQKFLLADEQFGKDTSKLEELGEQAARIL